MGRPRTKPGRGGKREGSGRPVVIGASVELHLRVTDSQARHVRGKREGVSAYIRRLIDQDRGIRADDDGEF